MSHETARQRHARQKRNPLRLAQIAPVHTVEPVRCARENCQHARLMHDKPVLAREQRGCLSYGCGCTEYVEA